MGRWILSDSLYPVSHHCPTPLVHLIPFSILVMGLAFLRLPHAQTKWRLKLLSAYQHHQHHAIDDSTPGENDGDGAVQRLRHRRTQGGKMILFGLPFITVLREGLEGVVFLGGIGLSEAPPAVAGGAIVGLIVGGFIGNSTSLFQAHLC